MGHRRRFSLHSLATVDALATTFHHSDVTVLPPGCDVAAPDPLDPLLEVSRSRPWAEAAKKKY